MYVCMYVFWCLSVARGQESDQWNGNKRGFKGADGEVLSTCDMKVEREIKGTMGTVGTSGCEDKRYSGHWWPGDEGGGGRSTRTKYEWQCQETCHFYVKLKINLKSTKGINIARACEFILLSSKIRKVPHICLCLLRCLFL